MKNHIIRLLKYALGLLLFLNFSSCSDEFELTDVESQFKQENATNESVLTKTISFRPISGTFDTPELICVDESANFCFTAPIGTYLEAQQYVNDVQGWVTVFLLEESITETTCFPLTFPSEGDFLLRYKIVMGDFIEVSVTAEDCSLPCTESKSETAYVGDNLGGNSKGRIGNNAWWYYFDIGDGLTNVSANVWTGRKSIDIGDVTYNAISKMITITLDDWYLESNNFENVKWYSYADGQLPVNGRPTPGKATNKGTSLTILASIDRYYAIHLDVVTCE